MTFQEELKERMLHEIENNANNDEGSCEDFDDYLNQNSIDYKSGSYVKTLCAYFYSTKLQMIKITIAD